MGGLYGLCMGACFCGEYVPSRAGCVEIVRDSVGGAFAAWQRCWIAINRHRIWSASVPGWSVTVSMRPCCITISNRGRSKRRVRSLEHRLPDLAG